jgi:hypothetical protein
MIGYERRRRCCRHEAVGWGVECLRSGQSGGGRRMPMHRLYSLLDVESSGQNCRVSTEQLLHTREWWVVRG